MRFFDIAVSFFDLIPVALRVEQKSPHANAVFMHGGFGLDVFQSLAGGFTQRDDVSAAEITGIVWSESRDACPKHLALCQAFNHTPSEPLFVFNSVRNAGYYRNEIATLEFLRRMNACILVTGHSHYTKALKLEQAGSTCQGAMFVRRPGASGPSIERYVGMTHQIVLSAHNFHQKTGSDEEDWGFFGVIVHKEASVVVATQSIFRGDETYDIVSQMLDVGVGKGEYPQPPPAGDCDFLRPRMCFSGAPCPP